MLDTTDDSALAAAARNGDREAFRRLLERHYAMIHRVACRYLGSVADAEDVAQDVCVTLATRIDGFAGRSRFSTWAVSIAINRCRDLLRQRRASAVLAERYVALRAAEDADRADDAERSAWLAEALAALEPRLRETVVLVVGEEMSHGEAAKALGCAETTVSWRMHVAKKQLGALFQRDE